MSTSTYQNSSKNTTIPGNVCVCTHCGEIGDVEIYNPFNLFAFVFFGAFAFIPVVVYWIWCDRNTKQVCARCGSEKVVAARTPIGHAIINKQQPNSIIGHPRWRSEEIQPKFGRKTSIILTLLTVISIYNAASQDWASFIGEIIEMAFLGWALVFACGAWKCFMAQAYVTPHQLIDWNILK